LKRIAGDIVCNSGHVLDGGYFENFGAATALELVQAAVSDAYRPSGVLLRPVIILISSDPNIVIENPASANFSKNSGCLADKKYTDAICLDQTFSAFDGLTGANETMGPIRGLLNARGARGILAAKTLRWWTERQEHSGAIVDPVFVHFRMQVSTDKSKPALGWMLSKESEDAIGRMLTDVDHNRRAMEEVLTAIGKS
jgi:hypothetical protein